MIAGAALALAGPASVSVAANVGSDHGASHAVHHGHNGPSSAMVDCPGHADGHKMPAGQCAAVCASLVSALHAGIMPLPGSRLPVRQPYTLPGNAVHASRTLNIPTPPPDAV